MPRTWFVRALVALSPAVVALSGAAVVGADYQPPVDAEVVDSFRPPAHRYGPGNRGVDYATEPGTPVTAVAAGAVVFAGQVGGTLHVTVLHPDGVRTSYSFLQSVSVRRGEQVERGQELGRTGPTLHLGARVGGEYVDPESLYSSRRGRAWLVPDDDSRG